MLSTIGLLPQNIGNIEFIVLAAGWGSRMLSDTPKPLHCLGSRPVVDHVLSTCRALNPSSILAVINKNLNYQFPSDVNTIIQENPMGTAHAVLTAIAKSKRQSDFSVVFFVDTPLITPETIIRLLNLLSSNKDFGIGILAFEPEEPVDRYGHLKIEQGDIVSEIIEFSPERIVHNPRLANSGIMLFRSELLFQLIGQVYNNNSSNEYRLTDLVQIAKKQFGINTCYITTTPHEAMGINTQQELARAESIFQDQARNKFLNLGIRMLDPSSVYLSFDTQIEAGVVIYPHVFISGGVKIEKGSIVMPFSYIEASHIKQLTKIGPFAYLRGNTIIENHSAVAGFTEVNGSQIKSNTKIKHLSYIGDSTIGEDTNIGAGTVVCNYDGQKKHRTHIGNKCFIGAHNTIISPIDIGNGCYTAAGSCINQDLPEGQSAIARARQINRKPKKGTK